MYRFLGTSGQNIDDLFKYSEAKNKLEFMERTLRWRHLVPTAPNTLGCYPFTDKDPFLIESCPHVYFVGNQDKYETTLLRVVSAKEEKKKARGNVLVAIRVAIDETPIVSFNRTF
ncbi:hypothetical protein C4D60_Mb11t19970 [Musa balbisiana]|uniref:DNA polymerase alpha/delta/epsilon subunit B domain-containing protein n=1 Tax=Musa balbisiana TaxID=52838 RepID=A0A4S8J5F5_MUSBA|nr:hypothetical protein C4D60_Mb11t19970 [Musa balbisiana]